LELTNEENVYSGYYIQEELANSDILELTNEENVYSGYYIQEELTNWKKNLRIFWSSQMRQEMGLFSSLSQRM
jgi:hypothetical protein